MDQSKRITLAPLSPTSDINKKGIKGVITSVSANYGEFRTDGTPVRADVDVKLKVAAAAAVGVPGEPRQYGLGI
jgi:hypothetical protein